MKLLLSAMLVVAALGQCTPQSAGPASGSGTAPGGETLGGPVASDALVRQQQCERQGGRWGQGGLGGFMVCYMTTRDSGKSCSSGNDCQSLCLAQSRTCAPVTPLYGCHSMLDNAGRRQEICID